MNWRTESTAISCPWSRPATQLAEIMAKVALELEAPQTKVRAVI
jgi:hypothetical protein